jgi:hypothetical protein
MFFLQAFFIFFFKNASSRPPRPDGGRRNAGVEPSTTAIPPIRLDVSIMF